MGILKRAISKDASAVSMVLDATDIVNKIESIAFPKNPVTNIFKSKFFFNKELIPPKTESNAAIIAIAKYPEYV